MKNINTIETIKQQINEVYENMESFDDPIYDIVSSCLEDELEELLFIESFIKNEH